MRLEVLVDGENPLYFPINKSRITIGTDLVCDIVLSASSLSKRHLIIITEGDVSYAMDQGSTNGSYMNESRLVPGQRVELTTYFPIRLGTEVLISLMSDQETLEQPITNFNEQTPPVPGDLPSQDRTMAISLKDLKKTQTKTLQKKREKIVSKSTAELKKQTVKKKKKKSFISVGPLILISLAIGWTYWSRNQKKNISAKPEEIVVSQNGEVSTQKKIISHAKFIPTAFETSKCVTPFEDFLCKRFIKPPALLLGVKAFDDKTVLFVDVSVFYKNIADLLPQKEELKEKFEDGDNWRLIFAALFIRSLELSLDPAKIGKQELVFQLYVNEDSKIQKASVILNPENIGGLKYLLNDKRLDAVREHGKDVLQFTDQFFRVVVH